MTTKIENLTQLRLEIIRLQSVRARQEITIKESFQDLNESLKPGNLAKSIVASFLSDKEETRNLLLYGINKGINYGINFIAEKLFLKDKPGIVKSIGHLLINNVVSKIVSFRSGTNIINTIKNIFRGPNADGDDSSIREETLNNPNS